MDWAHGYLIKQAIEKSAKRWFWRLAQLPPERRVKALKRIADSIDRPVEQLTWRDLAAVERQYGRISPQSAKYTKGWVALRERLKKRLEKIKGAVLSDKEFDVKYPMKGVQPGELRGLVKRPEEYLSKAYVKKPSGSAVDLQDLAIKPKKFVYKGITGEVDPFRSTDQFTSAFPEVAMDYLSPEGYLLKLKTPRKAVFTPHAGISGSTDDLRKLRLDVRDRVRQGEKVTAMGAGGPSSYDRKLNESPYYETILHGLTPKSILGMYKPLATSKGSRLQPMEFSINKKLLNRLFRTQKAWDTPVAEALPRGFKP